MNNRLFLLAMAVMVIAGSFSAQADVVQATQAHEIATDFLTHRQGGQRLNGASSSLALAYTRFSLYDHRKPLYYVFADDANGGWVMVAADDRAMHVLGYSESGRFDVNAMPCNMHSLLDSYSSQIEYLLAHPDVNAATVDAPRRGEALPAIAPLLTTAWGQSQPFNNQCPKVGYYPTYTGCVATAMAQVMYYYRYPVEQCRDIPAYTSKRGINLSALPAAAFDWESMLTNYYSYTSAQASAVAQLMRYCGQSVEMDYGTQASNATFQAIPFAMYYYFGYRSSVTTCMRDTTNDADWDQMMYDELALGRPVIYMGNDGNSGGHAFVLDGYRDGMFHINWGWSGDQDTYWQLTALTPNGYNYSTRQYAIVGLECDYTDVNDDQAIDISDVSDLIDMLLSGTIVGRVGDVNNDHVTDIADVSDLIDMLLSGVGQENTVGESFTVGGVTFKMVKVDGGSFDMGATDEQAADAYSNEFPVHRVTLSPYYIGKTEVTQGLWKAVMGTNPSSVRGVELPVGGVSWNDCMKFIEKLNELTGLSFRLPTEAEWEFAARGGKKSRGYIYSGSNDINTVAWYYDNACYSFGRCVALKAPNELGVYDMCGNNYEWCADYYGDYTADSQVNPQGPATGTDRVIRSGSWYTPADQCRNSSRVCGGPDETAVHIGFRLAM